MLVLLHFSSKDFEILDFDPPNNPTSHYGACNFGYNLALIVFFHQTELKKNIFTTFDYFVH